MPSWSFKSARLALVRGDITTSLADAIVNAANPGLLGGGGVDGAIHSSAGPELLAACREIVFRDGPLPTGKAVVTPGFKLSARHIIHTVGPVWNGGSANEETLLRSAYSECLRLANVNGFSRIAFPAISCGAYGYPLELAAPLALTELRRGLELGLVREAILWLHDARSLHFWSGVAEALFGPPQIP